MTGLEDPSTAQAGLSLSLWPAAMVDGERFFRERSGRSVLNGLKTNAQVLAEQFGIPWDPQWNNYLDILSGESFWTQMGNSTIVDAGFQDQTLLSHDRGWFDPALPGGGTPQPFTYLLQQFIPALLEAGIDESTIRHLTHDNPASAYAH